LAKASFHLPKAYSIQAHVESKVLKAMGNQKKAVDFARTTTMDKVFMMVGLEEYA